MNDSINDTALSVSNIELRLGKRQILKELSFSIQKSTSFAVVGHNGAGKTSLFHLILGLKFQTSGEIRILGQSNLDCESRKSLGYVPERPYLNLNLKFESFLNFHGKLKGLSGVKLRSEVKRVAEEVGLATHLKQTLGTFSKGMLQKSLLAQAVIGDPDFLLLDEPMSGLDPEARESVRQKMASWTRAGKTLVFSSHALEDVEQLASQVLILSEGESKFLGSVQEWRASR